LCHVIPDCSILQRHSLGDGEGPLGEEIDEHRRRQRVCHRYHGNRSYPEKNLEQKKLLWIIICLPIKDERGHKEMNQLRQE
jgi:hypothetical protein